MQPGTPRFSEGKTTSRPNIDTFGRYLIIFGRFFRGLSLRADSDSGGVNFYIFVPSLGLPKITARVGSSSSTAEKKAVRRHGVRSLIVYSISNITNRARSISSSIQPRPSSANRVTAPLGSDSLCVSRANRAVGSNRARFGTEDFWLCN